MPFIWKGKDVNWFIYLKPISDVKGRLKGLRTKLS